MTFCTCYISIPYAMSHSLPTYRLLMYPLVYVANTNKHTLSTLSPVMIPILYPSYPSLFRHPSPSSIVILGWVCLILIRQPRAFHRIVAVFAIHSGSLRVLAVAVRTVSAFSALTLARGCFVACIATFGALSFLVRSRLCWRYRACNHAGHLVSRMNTSNSWSTSSSDLICHGSDSSFSNGRYSRSAIRAIRTAL